MDASEAELMSELIVESQEHLEKVELILLDMEKGRTKGTEAEINEIFRAVHSIKGGFGFFNIVKITGLTHVMENTLAKLKAKTIEVTPKLVSSLLVGIDKVKEMMENIENVDSYNVENEIALFTTFVGGITEGSEEESQNLVDALNEQNVNTPKRLDVSKFLAPPLFSEEGDNSWVESRLDVYEAHRPNIIVGQKIAKLNQDQVKIDLDKMDALKGRWAFVKKSETPLAELSKGWLANEEFIFVINLNYDFEFLEVLLEIETSQAFQLIEGKESELMPKKEEPKAVVINTEVSVDELGSTKKINLGTSRDQDVIRVKVNLLNTLIDHAGEMVLNRNQLLQMLSRRVSDVIGHAQIDDVLEKLKEDLSRRLISQNPASLKNEEHLEKLLCGEMANFKKGILEITNFQMNEVRDLNTVIQSLDRNTSHLQETIMKTRMQAIDVLFNRFPRMVRDLSKSINKDIEVVISSSSVELDKTIIEKLGDPMVHLIRNSVDHGIEPTEVRVENGKPKQGRITLNAIQEGGKIIISIQDDGGGINTEKVKEIAINKGLISADVAANMSEAEANELIFKPGFSTAEKVTNISGRGVGMDVVKTNIGALGGTIEIESQRGRGSRFIMKLPLTLAIIPAMIVASHKLRFTIPQMIIEELVGVSGSDVTSKIQNLHDSEIIRLRDDVLPLIRLSKVLGVEPMFKDIKTGEWKVDKRERWSDRRASEGEVSEEIQNKRDQNNKDRRKSVNNDLTVIVLKHGDHRFGLVVEEVLDNEEIVVKPLPTLLKESNCYSGTTILGDGSVAMILDANGLAQLANLQFQKFTDDKVEMHRKYESEALAENQNYLLFDQGVGEKFAIHMELIGRVEKINIDKVQVIGNKKVVNLENGSLRVLELSDYLPVQPRVQKGDSLYIIIPKLVKNPIGILCNNIVDTIKVQMNLKDDVVKSKGMLGTIRWNSELIVLLDLYSLFEVVDPEIYSKEVDPQLLAGKKVILAEDTEFFRKIISKFLMDFGADLDVAVDGEEAWNLMETGKKYDLVVTDIQMPKMNGFALSSKIRESYAYPDVPIMALTSMNLQNYRLKGIEAGIDRYELKFDKEKQKMAMRDLLREKRA